MRGQHYAVLAGIAVPVFLIFRASLIAFFRWRSLAAGLRAVGSGFLVIIVLAHVCETFRLLRWMNWGQQHSPGHYLDLASAIVGPILLLVGHVLASAASNGATAKLCPNSTR